MREIKFRAWSYGRMNYFDNPKDGLLYSCGEMQLSSGHDGEDNPTFYGDPEFALMQFTGLKDKNGTEIYEGDIVKVDYATGPPSVYVVEYENANLHPFAGYDENEWIDACRYSEYEVIGNIHQNPELIP